MNKLPFIPNMYKEWWKIEELSKKKQSFLPCSYVLFRAFQLVLYKKKNTSKTGPMNLH
jgi:hypothetical protein